MNAESLARMNAHVIMACRNRSKSEAVLADIKRDTGNARLEHMALDLASFASVDRFVAAFRARGLPLHLLLNNAGVSGIYERTEDHFDLIMQVNYISKSSR